MLLWNNPAWFPAGAAAASLLCVCGAAADRRRSTPSRCRRRRHPACPAGRRRTPASSRASLRRDPGATDIYTNAVTLRRIIREGWLDLLFAASLEKVEYLEEQGIRSWYVPYGYHPSYGTILGLERTIDVLFLGDRGPRAPSPAAPLSASARDDVDARGSWSDPSLWGESRSRLLNQTKIVVHLQRYPGKTAAMRLVLALANGAMVVAEPCYRPDPFVPGVHYAEAPVEELPDLIRYYLEHDDERERIVAAGHRLVTEELTFARSAQMVLEVIRERLDARADLTRPDRGRTIRPAASREG